MSMTLDGWRELHPREPSEGISKDGDYVLSGAVRVIREEPYMVGRSRVGTTFKLSVCYHDGTKAGHFNLPLKSYNPTHHLGKEREERLEHLVRDVGSWVGLLGINVKYRSMLSKVAVQYLKFNTPSCVEALVIAGRVPVLEVGIGER